MNPRYIGLPILAFAAVFVAAATLQPANSSFSRSYGISGGVALAEFILSPTPGPRATEGTTSSATPRPGGRETPTGTPTPAASVTATAAATATATPRPVSSPTATRPAPTQTPTAGATLTPSATPMPGPCGGLRASAYAFNPGDQTLRVSGAGKGSFDVLFKAPGPGDRRLRVTVVSGAAYLTGLTIEGDAWRPDAKAPAHDFKVPGLGEAASMAIVLAVTTAFPGLTPATDTTAAAPAIELRFEVIGDCPLSFLAVIPPFARVLILPAPRPVPLPAPIKPAPGVVAVQEGP